MKTLALALALLAPLSARADGDKQPEPAPTPAPAPVAPKILADSPLKPGVTLIPARDCETNALGQVVCN